MMSGLNSLAASIAAGPLCTILILRATLSSIQVIDSATSTCRVLPLGLLLAARYPDPCNALTPRTDRAHPAGRWKKEETTHDSTVVERCGCCAGPVHRGDCRRGRRRRGRPCRTQPGRGPPDGG